MKYSLLKRVYEIAEIAKQEVRNIFSDKAIFMVFFVAILVYPILYSFTYNPEVLRDVKVAVVDADNTSSSRLYARMLDAHENVVLTQKHVTLQDAKREMLNGTVNGILYIEKGFEKNVLSNKQALVSVYCDASYFLYYKQVLTAAKYSNATFSAGIQLKKLLLKGMPQKQAMAFIQPIRTNSIPLYNSSAGYGTYVMPAVLFLILQQTLLIGIGILTGSKKEKQSFHFMYSYAKRFGGATSLIIGKSVVYLIIYLLHSFYTLFVIYKLFNFPQRAEFYQVFLFLVPFLLAVIFLAFIISSAFRNRENAILILAFTTVPFLLLSGISWPVESMPQWCIKLSQIIPSTPGVKGFLKMNQMGASFSEIKEHFYHLWILAGVYFVGAVTYVKYLQYKYKQKKTVA